mmetsp:Transcript_12783/g.29157  ORF Transcript_12783/g.29157 Transcript_12783/m.29157 type:complete len:130 (-) Transcript_12783:602-991(-)
MPFECTCPWHSCAEARRPLQPANSATATQAQLSRKEFTLQVSSGPPHPSDPVSHLPPQLLHCSPHIPISRIAIQARRRYASPRIFLSTLSSIDTVSLARGAVAVGEFDEPLMQPRRGILAKRRLTFAAD